MQAFLKFLLQRKQKFEVNSVACYAEKGCGAAWFFSDCVQYIYLRKGHVFLFFFLIGSKICQQGSMMFIVCLSSKLYFPRNLVLNVCKCVIYCFDLCKLLSCFTVV